MKKYCEKRKHLSRGAQQHPYATWPYGKPLAKRFNTFKQKKSTRLSQIRCDKHKEKCTFGELREPHFPKAVIANR